MRRLSCLPFVVAACFAAASPAHGAALVPLAPAASWGSAPIFVTAPPGDPRVFVVERGGSDQESTTAAIRVVKNGILQSTPFLTLSNVNTKVERGVESMAFAPDYATSGLFYVFKVEDVAAPNAAESQIVEYKVSATDPDVADPASARVVLRQLVMNGNHIGGQLAFGPDGLLYITLGENGVGTNAQDKTTLLGKVLRIDPHGTLPDEYTVPPSNPFVGMAPAKPEIWAFGFRNPFRAGFTPDGRLVVGDVGEVTTEELDVITPGTNYGWRPCEGTACSPALPENTPPFFSYTHAPDGNCAVIGGYVVRDPRLTGLTGRYLYGDLCKGDLRTVNLDVAGGDPQPAGLTVTGATLNSFGEDARGCTYVVANNTVSRVAESADASADCPPQPIAQCGCLPPTQPPPTPPTPPPVTPKALAALVKETLSMDSKGRVRVRVSCAGGLKCTGAISLRTAKATRAGGAKTKRIVKLGTLRFSSLTANKQSTVKLALDAKARKIVRELRRLKVKLILGGVERTTTLAVASR